MVLWSPTGLCAVKNESHLSTAKVTPFYSEFNADFEYLIPFKKYRGQKKFRLTATGPLGKLGKARYPAILK
jgi:hypothetical protein